MFVEGVLERAGNREYFVENNRDESSGLVTQKDIHIFPLGKEFYLHEGQNLEYVLAPVKEAEKMHQYLPAEVTSVDSNNEQTLVIRFCDGET